MLPVDSAPEVDGDRALTLHLSVMAQLVLVAKQTMKNAVQTTKTMKSGIHGVRGESVV